MASVPNLNPPLALEPNPLNFSPGFIPVNPPKTSEKILCLEGKSPGLYPALARQLRQEWLAEPFHPKCILPGDSPMQLGQWHRELFPCLPELQVHVGCVGGICFSYREVKQNLQCANMAPCLHYLKKFLVGM